MYMYLYFEYAIFAFVSLTITRRAERRDREKNARNNERSASVTRHRRRRVREFRSTNPLFSTAGFRSQISSFMNSRDDFAKVEMEKTYPRKLHSCVMRFSFGVPFFHDRIMQTYAANGVYKLRDVIIPLPVYWVSYMLVRFCCRSKPFALGINVHHRR